ncbi:MAG: LysR family transcriptional regulator [Oscillospiraceae bacterium]|nr:LysR family transcriptional regulator [Oscillospiraceae bacterium]
MEIRLLQEFVSLVETKSFQETSEQMNISQSTLTKHIHKLEDEMGVSLFDRSTRSVELNEYSKTYYPYAEKIVKLYEEGDAMIAALLSQGKNVLRVALTPALAHYSGIEVLSDFSREFSQYRLEITECPRVIDLLTDQKCDFVFAMENDAMDGHMSKLLYKIDRLVVVFPASHPLAALKEVTLEQLRDERFIFHRNSSGEMHLETRKFLQLCKDASFKPTAAANISSISTIVKMVSQEQGIAILHQGQIPADAEDIFWTELIPTVHSHIYALYLNNKPMSAACRAFRSYLLQRIDRREEAASV